MEFSLLYQGPLKSNGATTQKQEIRRVFHPQLKSLWQQIPLNSFHEFLQENPPQGKISILKKVGVFTFAPLVSESLRLSAELDIIFLRPEAPGSIITQGGDIDNRLKTLFDALRMAKRETEIPSGDTPNEGENPFFCVLEDDSLITKVSVKTDRLLITAPSDNYVHLLITVKTKMIVGTWFNISIG
jgi:hypothetical protein